MIVKMSFCWHHPNWKCIVGCIIITVKCYMCGLPSRLDFLSYYFAALNHIVWKRELFDVICDKIVVARIHESSSIYLMLWHLDAKHVAIATEKEADTERCAWKKRYYWNSTVSSAVTSELCNVIERHLFRSSMLHNCGF